MITDTILAILHHLLVVAIIAALAAEAVLVRPGLDGRNIKRLAVFDAVYGVAAASIIVVGAGRVAYGLKGWDYYAGNHAFWTKMGCFALLGLLSIAPTIRFLRWRRAAAADPAFVVPGAEILSVRKYLRAEMVLLVLIPSLAAIMARFG